MKFTQNGRFEIVQGKGAGTAAEPRHLRRLVAIGPPLLAGDHAAHGAEEQAEEDEEERTAEEEEALRKAGSKKTQEEQKRWFSDRPNQTTIRSPLTALPARTYVCIETLQPGALPRGPPDVAS